MNKFLKQLRLTLRSENSFNYLISLSWKNIFTSFPLEQTKTSGYRQRRKNKWFEAHCSLSWILKWPKVRGITNNSQCLEPRFREVHLHFNWGYNPQMPRRSNSVIWIMPTSYAKFRASERSWYNWVFVRAAGLRSLVWDSKVHHLIS